MKLHELLEKLYALRRAGVRWYAEAHGSGLFYIGYLNESSTNATRVGWVECEEGTIKRFTPSRTATYGDVELVRTRIEK